MSHFAEIKINALVKNEKELIAALEAHFGAKTVEVHNTAVQLQGMDGRAGKMAHLVVRKKNVKTDHYGGGAYNDLGFWRKEDGTYVMHVDDMDVRASERNKIIQDYAIRVSTKQLKAKGYTVKRQEQKDGTVKLVATKYA